MLFQWCKAIKDLLEGKSFVNFFKFNCDLVVNDLNYVIRVWMVVVIYLLFDAWFLLN